MCEMSDVAKFRRGDGVSSYAKFAVSERDFNLQVYF